MTEDVAVQFTMSRRVQFSETDMAGIVHFANYYKYLEETEHAFFRSLGMRLMHEQADGVILGWPRVRATCSFEAPAFYDDVLEIDLIILRKGVKSLTFGFRVRRGATPVAFGEVKTVCCAWRKGEPFHSVPIPPELDARLVESPRGFKHVGRSGKAHSE